MTTGLLMLALCGTLTLAGCGQTGALYLPDDAPASEVNEPAADDATSDDSNSQDET